MAQKTVLVFGVSGIVGEGAAKALLDKGYRVAAVFRSVESAQKAKERLNNPPEEKLVTVIGQLTSEESAEELKRSVLAKTGGITDVVAAIGAWWQKGPVLDQSLEELTMVLKTRLEPHFVAAKTFLPLIADTNGTSYTFITGAVASMPYIPDAGLTIVNSSALRALTTVVMEEYKSKPVRINNFSIFAGVGRWDNLQPGTVSNLDMGKAIEGVITHPVSKGQVLEVQGKDMEKVSQTGTD